MKKINTVPSTLEQAQQALDDRISLIKEKKRDLGTAKSYIESFQKSIDANVRVIASIEKELPVLLKQAEEMEKRVRDMERKEEAKRESVKLDMEIAHVQAMLAKLQAMKKGV